MKLQKESKGLSSDTLKWIALFTMVIDHIGASVLEKTPWFTTVEWVSQLDFVLRLIGRIAFPIYCFLLVEGFWMTQSRKRYARNLFLFALISEIPFELSFMGGINPGFHNVYWTLLMGMLLMLVLEKVKLKTRVRYELGAVVFVAVFAILAQVFRTDYGAIGVMLIFILYHTREERKKQSVLGAIAMCYEITAPISFLLTYHYNGKRKNKNGVVGKYFFYVFYPVHLLVLYWVKLLILQ